MSNDLSKAVWFETKLQENVFARARRVFHLDPKPGSAIARVACSGRYRLWLNGEPVGRGPALSGTNRRRFDVLDLTDVLRSGENLLAVQAIHFGYKTAQTPDGPPALWLELECDGRIVLTTDEEWRFSVDPAYANASPRRNNSYGPQEVFDASKDEPWREIAFDDSA
ncbi:MAG: alpha-L-rhamnosidase N-terminal domain-containing protein [Candidatus Sumerlaeota bacterium]|nr:alpha-L-rhamnosidase N-terminal domain-containing protein [Candidatus Sumerlaeota bacterium]